MPSSVTVTHSKLFSTLASILTLVGLFVENLSAFRVRQETICRRRPRSLTQSIGTLSGMSNVTAILFVVAYTLIAWRISIRESRILKTVMYGWYRPAFMF